LVRPPSRRARPASDPVLDATPRRRSRRLRRRSLFLSALESRKRLLFWRFEDPCGRELSPPRR
jgi:hypothetical protein